MKKQNLASRLWQYQAERFPIFGHGPLVAAFSFSAISYSIISRGAEGFVPWQVFGGGIFITISLFLLVRIFDEFKDREDDLQHRPHLPVPRGLVTLGELRNVGIMAVLLQLAVQCWLFPQMLPFYFMVVGYLCLMGKEFFAVEWLKARPFWYVTSHMVIIPLVDVYASGLDWHLSGANPPFGLVFFFLVSFLNGIVLEIGRKIRTPENEEFNTYSTMMGAGKATRLWLWVLFATLLAACAAAWYAGFGWVGAGVLIGIFILCGAQGILFLSDQTPKKAKFIEYASAFWTIAMYLTLGGIPMLFR
ncbi:MAG: UbiA family prenyltransferase [Saprospiraceae bacterium]